MASVKEKEKNVELKPLRNIVKLRTYHSIHMGNVDVLVHIKGLDSSTFPSQVEQITTNVPDLDITDQRGRLGTITLVASVERFKMLCIFLRGRPDVGKIHSFQAQELQDEPVLAEFFREETRELFSASPAGSVAPSSSV
jgi:hypothetical protein